MNKIKLGYDFKGIFEAHSDTKNSRKAMLEAENTGEIPKEKSDDTIYENLVKAISALLSEDLKSGESKDRKDTDGSVITLTRDDEPDAGTSFTVEVEYDIPDSVKDRLDKWVEDEGFIPMEISTSASTYSFGTVSIPENMEESADKDADDVLETKAEDEAMTLEKAVEFLKAAFDEDDLKEICNQLIGKTEDPATADDLPGDEAEVTSDVVDEDLLEPKEEEE
jgi:hypothetical protein